MFAAYDGSFSDGYNLSGTDRHHRSDTDCNPGANLYTGPDSYRNPGANRHTGSDSYRNSGADRNSEAYCHTGSYQETDADTGNLRSKRRYK